MAHQGKPTSATIVDIGETIALKIIRTRRLKGEKGEITESPSNGRLQVGVFTKKRIFNKTCTKFFVWTEKISSNENTTIMLLHIFVAFFS